MSDLRRMPKSFVLEFIELYRKSPCLWDLRSKKYFDRSLKKAAYEKLKNKLRELIPNATRDMVIKKILSIRGSFRNELKKVKESQNSGKVAVYKPRLWYFEKLMFLKERGRKRRKNENKADLKELEESDVSELTTDDNPNQTSRTCTPSSTVSSSSSKLKNHKRGKFKLDDVRDHVLQACEKLLSEEEDEFDIVGRNIANKLRRLSKDMQFATEKLIIDILYQASIGNVNQQCTVTINK